MHPKTHAYYEWVNEQFEGITENEDAYKKLDDIRQTIQRGETPWDPQTCAGP